MKNSNEKNTDPFILAKEMAFGDIHFKHNADAGLTAIIAIHNTNLGPSLGGCRYSSYPSTQDAIIDAMRLAQGMSYKAAISGLPLGGGKSVIIKSSENINRKKLFSAFGDFVEELGGRYITAVDSGTTVDDMDIIATRTNHVSSTSQAAQNTGDPSPYTALGVRRAIEAAVSYRYGTKNMSDIHVAIQGVGHVGYFLAKELFSLGARLTYCDINASAVEKVNREFPGEIVDVNKIYDVECDVFSPCALGGAINLETVPRLKTHIIAGAANNQLSTNEIADLLQQKDILYAPDYVVNAGGLIQIALIDEMKVQQNISNIYATTISIFEQAKSTGLSSANIADKIAKDIIDKAGTKHASGSSSRILEHM